MNHYQVAFLDKAAEIDTSLSPTEFIAIALFFKQVFDLMNTQQFQIWQKYHSSWIPVHGVESLQLRLLPPDTEPSNIESLYDFVAIGEFACEMYKQYADEKKVIEKFNKRRSVDRERFRVLSKRLMFVDNVVSVFPEEWQISFDRYIRQGHKQVSIWMELNMSDSKWKRLWRDSKYELGKAIIERADKKEFAKILEESGRNWSDFEA